MHKLARRSSGNPISVPIPISAWPGQEDAPTDVRVPSLMYYSAPKTYQTPGQRGSPPKISFQARAFGAQCLSWTTRAQAAQGGWILVKKWRDHLEQWRATSPTEREPLPIGLSLEQVYSDWLGYIFAHTETFFTSREPDGADDWDSDDIKMTLIISASPTWLQPEEDMIARAAARAGIIGLSAPLGRSVRFIWETKAGIHWLMARADIRTPLGTNFKVRSSSKLMLHRTFD